MLIVTLFKFIDWFVPNELRTNTAGLWRSRIFVISHLSGPCLGAVIMIYLYFAEPEPGIPFYTICMLVAAFWVLPFAMKLTRRFTWVALFSICDLAFIGVFGSFFYGGVSSPFMPWFLTALLLGFFYLGERPLLVLGIFAAHLLGFCVAYALNGSFPELVPVAGLSGVGVISVCLATVYVSMMAIYYANVITAQSELRQEIERHLVTADKMLAAKRRADRASEAKAAFLAKMSHQLRTPLNAVIGYSEILLEDAEATGDLVQTADLKTINLAGRHLLSLVADVLHMPKIESDNLEAQIQWFDLAQLVDDAASTCRNLVTQNRNKFVIELPPDLGGAFSDQTRLRQILINLLSNAGKFTSDGTVTLRVSRGADAGREMIIMEVEDSGIGMSTATLEGLFVDFRQADASTSSMYGGTGLGLALSRKLCQLLDGEITVESELGNGAKFTVRVPADAGPVAAAA